MATPTNPMWAHLSALTANPFIPELHADDCDDVTCVRCEPMAIDRLDVPLAVVEAQTAPDLEQQLAELRAHAEQHLAERGAKPSPEHWVQWHEFFDIDPDLRNRDYGQPGGTR
ncbi:hypothetical protein NLX86_19110 [Streptomyces sp. A3M-1-3]|uniref:hypothetical protein n=1 Tax=Streptomyces sp. A3M-1-3 TaxID=2962044 RepID=UPI0020B681E1|nr:hypothetical protein [Streptomyces sp. A3M-1-3]MCP3820129.1 hypothetical protein [Streptomyces sp. A3M-1-3]